MTLKIGGRYDIKRQIAVSNRCIQFLVWANDNLRSFEEVKCGNVLVWLEDVLVEHPDVLDEYAEYLEKELTYRASTIKGHLYDLK